jgi:protein-S-isoprenylcysteine O-methyltransferase Ste14
LPDRTLYTIPFPWRWLSLAGQCVALTALVWTALQTDVLRFAGLSQLLTRNPAKRESLQVHGFYCYVRHPLYLFSLVVMWLTPCMTANLVTPCALMTLYFYVGSIFEERRLLSEFGPADANYRDRVPRLLPRLKPCDPLDNDSGNAVQ